MLSPLFAAACLPRAHRLGAALLCLLAGAADSATPRADAAPTMQPGHPSAPEPAAGAPWFSIPAGPLAQVVAQYAHAAGVALSFDAAPLAARRSPGLQGRFGVEAGFARVLDGSGLQAVRTAAGAYTLRVLPTAAAPAPVADSAMLDTVTVTAAAPPGPLTDGTGAYAAGSAAVFHTEQPLRRIPQPVTVVTRQLMDDRALTDLRDVLQQAPGIAVDYIDTERITYWSRGHQIDMLQVDGLPVSQNSAAAVFIQPDTAVLDRVEVLRDAAGLLQGAGQPSATVNMVRKRPLPQFRADARVAAGTWGRRRAEADLSGSWNAAGTLRGRIVAAADHKGFAQTAREEERQTLYGVLEADLGPATQLTGGLQHTQLEATGAWGGLPAATNGSPLGLPRSTYLGTDWNRWDRHNQQAFAELEQRWDAGWSTRLRAAHTRFRSDGFKQASFSAASATDPYLVNVSTAVYGGEASDQNAMDFSAQGPFTLFGRTHQLVAGAQVQRVHTTGSAGVWGLAPLSGVDVRTWNPSTSYPEPSSTTAGGTPYRSPDTRTAQDSLYGKAHLSLSDRLTAIAGARLTHWRHGVTGQPASGYRVPHELTPYAGLVYDLSPGLSAYASYSEVFSPQNYRDVGGRLLAPVEGRDIEAGLKAQWWEGRADASLSLFRIHQRGRAEQDMGTPTPCLPYYTDSACYRAGGTSRSEGIEAEVAGLLQPGWQLSAGYTYTRTAYLQATPTARAGEPLRSIDPRHALRLFSTYQLRGPLQGWTVGGGARVQSGSYVTVGGTTAHQGGYAVFDALLRYRIDTHLTVQLHVNNLFDKVYFSKFSPNSTYFNNYYGDPRNVMLSVRAQF